MSTAATAPFSDSHNLDLWNEALLEVLLPVLPDIQAGSALLLACDDETVVEAADLIGVEARDAVALVGQAVELRYGIASRGGLQKASRDAVLFATASDRAKRTPPYLAVCALMALAASRMNTEKGMRATNFYERFWETLGTPPQRKDPYGFSSAPRLFEHLADWLADDLDGARGTLIIRESHPAYVGCAINQCLFRARDREHLAEFFAQRLRGNPQNLDLLRLLQISPDSNYLTLPAKAVITDPALQDAARLALGRLWDNWDGTVPDEHGSTYYPGTLHLRVGRQPSLWVTSPDREEERIPIDSSQLGRLSSRALRLPRGDGRPGVYLPATGDTILFELSEASGLVWSRAPTQEKVFVLSRDFKMWTLQRYQAPCALGDGWLLYERVPLSILPQHVLEQSASMRVPVKLTGGLRLHAGWLAGHPPRLEAGDLQEDLAVEVDGERYGQLESGDELQLDLSEGDHRVEVGGGLARFDIHILAVNPARAPYGQLACSLTTTGLQAGASADPPEPYACGAALSADHDGETPLLYRAKTVKLLLDDGQTMTHQAPPNPSWVTEVGLDPEACRWELQPAENVIWVLGARSATLVRPAPFHMKLDAAGAAAVNALGENPQVRAANRGVAAKLDSELDRLRKLARQAAGQEEVSA